MEEVGLEHKEHNMIVCLRFSISECIREATAKALWEKLGTLYQSKSLVKLPLIHSTILNLRHIIILFSFPLDPTSPSLQLTLLLL